MRFVLQLNPKNMMNKKFKRAAIQRKFAAFLLTVLSVFGLLSLLFIQSESGSFFEIAEAISAIFSSSNEDAASTNYP